MAYTKFVNDLGNAVNTGNRDKVASLLNKAKAADWTAAGTDISNILDMLPHSKFNLRDMASFATTIVSKGTVNSSALAEAVGEFINTGYSEAAKGMLTAASAAELKAPSVHYDNLLNILPGTKFLNPDEKAELAKLVVAKTTVSSVALADAVGKFISMGHTEAAKGMLTAASAAELTEPKSSSGHFDNLLNLIPGARLNPGEQAELAKLVVAKATVGSVALAELVGEFVNVGHFEAAKGVLTAASAAELKASPDHYGSLLDLISGTRSLGAVQQAELAKLIISKTVVDAESVAETVVEFALGRNLAGVNAVMSAASAAEKAAMTLDVHHQLMMAGYRAENDSVTGTKNNDMLYGYGGNDKLYGGAGSDMLHGGLGNDRLEGQGGADRLFGGVGADNFVISAKDARDTIIDFSAAQRDVLTIESTLFSASKSRVEAAIDDFVIARTVGNDTIISIDADGRGAGKAVEVAVLQNVKNVDVDVWHAKGLIDIG